MNKIIAGFIKGSNETPRAFFTPEIAI